MKILQQANTGSALVITLMFILLLGLEALVVGLLLSRSTGTEAVLRGKNQSVRRASELILNDLSKVIYEDIINSSNPATTWAKYKRDGSITTYSGLTSNRYNTVNPESGINDQLNIDTSGWIQEYRGNYFHLVGRAKSGDVDLITHKWILVKPCASNGGGVLTTIISNAKYPGYLSTVVDSTGRVFFGTTSDTSGNPSTLSPFYTWSPITNKLSTVITGYGPGNRTAYIASDDRVYFGGGPSGQIYTWKDDILTTIISLNQGGQSCDSCGNYMRLDPRNDRLYVAAVYNGVAITYKPTIGMTTLSTAANDDGSVVLKTMVFGMPDEAYFMGMRTGNRVLYRWTPAGGVQTEKDLTAAGVSDDPYPLLADLNGRVFLSQSNNAGKTYLYQHSGGVWNTFYPSFDISLWQDSLVLMANGNVFFGSGGGSHSNIFSWTPSALTTLIPLAGSYWSSELANPARTMVAYGHNYTGVDFHVWNSSGILSTIGSGIFDYPAESFYSWWEGATNNGWYNNNVLYFGQRSTQGRLYQWDASTNQLSTVMKATSSTVRNIGTYGSIAIDNNQNIYFGSYATAAQHGAMFGWSPASGLTTIVYDRNYPGVYSLAANRVQGGVYFGEGTSSGNFYYYGPSANGCATRPY